MPFLIFIRCVKLTTMDSLNSQQQAAVSHTKSPLLIIAGAGTGKTTVITRRVAELLSNGANPQSIVALSFTEKAATELSERVDSLLQKPVDIFAGTFHRFCQNILEGYGLDLGLPTPFKLITPPQSWQLFKNNLDQFDLHYYRPFQNPTSLISALLQHFSRCKDELITPEHYLQYATELRGDTDIAEYRRSMSKKQIEKEDSDMLEYARIDEVARAYHTFEQLKLKENLLDFGDLISYSNTLLEQRPNIKEALQKKYQYILVDEFQDTNYAQYELIKKLSGNGEHLTVVADDDQSIYKWRGASVSNVLSFAKDFDGAKTIILKENYRSGQGILDAAYTLIQNNNPDRLEVRQNIDKKLTANNPSKGAVSHLHVDTSDTEVQTVVKKIQELLEDGTPAQNIAILARANTHIQPFLRGLQNAHIPCHYGAATGLLKTRVVLDCIAVLRAVNNTHDQNAWFRLLRLPPFTLSHEDQSILWNSSERKGKTLSDVLKLVSQGLIMLSQDGHSKIKKLLSSVSNGARAEKKSSITNVLLIFLEETGYLKSLTLAEQSGEPSAIDDLLQLKAFFEMIETQAAEMSAKEFVLFTQDLLASGEQGSSPTDAGFGQDAVALLTAHSAKGLEFDHVFIVNMVEQRFPSRGRREKIQIPEALIKENVPEGDHHLQEERRLFYVALTRARLSVTLTSAQSYGGKTQRKISRFIKEAGIENTLPESTFDILKVAKTDLQPKSQNPLLPLPKSYSHSQLKSYADCPLQYKYAHVLGIKSRQSAAMVFGNTIHATLQRFYQRVAELNATKQADLFSEPTPKGEGVFVPALPELLTIYKELWRDDWFIDDTQRAAYFEEGQNMLQLFYKQQSEKGWTIPLLLEKGFKLKVESHTLRGFIDRIDKEGNQLTIIDYKTGRPKERLSPTDKQQLLLYQMAAKEMPELHASGPMQLTYYYLSDGSEKSFSGTEQDLQTYKETILTLIAGIQKREFSPKPNPVTCNYCEFKDICEFRA